MSHTYYNTVIQKQATFVVSLYYHFCASLDLHVILHFTRYIIKSTAEEELFNGANLIKGFLIHYMAKQSDQMICDSTPSYGSHLTTCEW